METKNARRHLPQLRVWWIGAAALIVLAAVWSTRNNAGPDRTLRELGRAIIAGDDLLIDQYINYSKVTPSFFADWAAVGDSNAALAPPPALMSMFQQSFADELRRLIRPGGEIFDDIFLTPNGKAEAVQKRISLLSVRAVNGQAEAVIAFSDSLTDTTFSARLRLEREADKKWRVVGVSGMGVAVTALFRKREEFVDSVNGLIFDRHAHLIKWSYRDPMRIFINDVQFVGFWAMLRNTSTLPISAVVFGLKGPGVVWQDIPIRAHLQQTLEPGDTTTTLGVVCAEGATARVRRVWLNPKDYRVVIVGVIAASDSLLPFRSWEDYHHARRYIVPEAALRRNCGEYGPGPPAQESRE